MNIVEYELQKGEHYAILDSASAQRHRPEKVTAFKTKMIVYFFVECGYCVMSVNLEEVTLNKGSVCTIFPGEIIDMKTISPDLRVRVLVVGKEMIGDAFVRIGYNVMDMLFRHRHFTIVKPEVDKYINNILDNLEFIYAMEDGEFKYEQAMCQIRCLACYFYNRVSKSNISNSNAKYNRLEEHFRRFMKLLVMHFKESREVAYYANLLHLTPKYLNFICNTVAQRTCKSFIDQYVIIQLKNELKRSEKTIQEIAYEFNFANQSFLGCYFKKYTGLSPRKFRNGNDTE